MGFPEDLQCKHEAAFAMAKRLPGQGIDLFWEACEQAVTLSAESGGITKESFLDFAARQNMDEDGWLFAMIGLSWGLEAQKAKREDPCT